MKPASTLNNLLYISNTISLSGNRLLSDEQKGTIIFLIKFFPEVQRIDIAKIINVVHSTITKIWNKYCDTGTVKNNFGNCGGGKRKFEVSDIELIENMIKNNNNGNLKLCTFQKEIKKIKRKDVSISSISRGLRYSDIFYEKPIFIPKLTNEHKMKRLKYCNEYKDDKFSDVIFSDEVFFQLNENKNLVWYRKSKENPKPKLEKINNKRKIKVGGAISRKKKFTLVVGGGKMNGEKYKQVLLDCDLFAIADKTYGVKKWRFMHDNAPPHIKKEISNALNERCYKIIKHPSCSPDLNPIEHVGGWMKKKISTFNFTELEQIEICIEGLGNKLDLATINSFINHHVQKIPKIKEVSGCYVD